MKKITQTMKNSEIYMLAIGFLKNFDGETTLPIKVNFYLTKNKQYFVRLGAQIDEMRKKIGENPDKEQVKKELQNLSELEQEVSFYQVDLEDFGNVDLSMEQIEILQFMIKEE